MTTRVTLGGDREHKCGKIPGQYQVGFAIFSHEWMVVELERLLVRPINYCPWCGKSLTES